MSSFPFVSCLMPTKNRRAFIPRALAMFMAQDYPGRAELIVLEDGDDNCSDILAGVEECDTGHIHRLGSAVIYDRGAGTLGAKLNAAASMASGEICINWDDDDWNAPNRISTQVAHMQLTGKPVVGLSSLIYYAEGEQFGWEYTGDAWYASGSSHCYRRDWILSHPRPDMTVGEDNVFAAEAKREGAISNLSGSTVLVACDHAANCSNRGDPALNKLIRETADNFRRVPLSEFAATIGPYGSH
jgi:glycosyltransferase involved in cell wall biosynthesis